jgi:hypothetical protein
MICGTPNGDSSVWQFHWFPLRNTMSESFLLNRTLLWLKHGRIFKLGICKKRASKLRVVHLGRISSCGPVKTIIMASLRKSYRWVLYKTSWKPIHGIFHFRFFYMPKTAFAIQNTKVFFLLIFYLDLVFLIQLPFFYNFSQCLFDAKVLLICIVQFFCKSVHLHLTEHCPFLLPYSFCICFTALYFGMLWSISVLLNSLFIALDVSLVRSKNVFFYTIV